MCEFIAIDLEFSSTSTEILCSFIVSKYRNGIEGKYNEYIGYTRMVP